MIAPSWIAVDWGTSRCRVWAMDGGSVLAETSGDKGMGGLTPDQFEPALLELLTDWSLAPATPVIACGMVGARQGWVEAGYASVPTAPLSAQLTKAPTADPRLDVRIISGLSQDRPADVMRGEETQIAGFLSMNDGFDGVLCLPGSHTKWAQISAGEVVSFQTTMTGEMFAALSRHTVLRHGIGPGWDDAAFAGAIDDALSQPEKLASRLFSLRAEGLLHKLDQDAAKARLSGLLIGAELAATRPYWLGQHVALIGDATLCDHYAAALSAQGVPATRTRADRLTLAGLTAAYRLWKD